MILGSIGFASSAYYVTDPENCPNNYQSQTCSGSDLVCGYSGGVTFCYDMSTLNPPAGSSTTTGSGGTNYACSDTACDGGFVTDCYAYDGGEPYCDNSGNFWCDRSSTCYNKHVQTTCTGNLFNDASCSATCTTNYFECDGDTTDADGCEIHAGDSCGSGTGTIVYNQCYSASAGNCTSATRLDCDNSDSDGNTATCNVGNGCEILIGGSCTVGVLSGTYDNYCSGGAGVCIVDKSYFETGTNTSYSTNASQHFFWGNDYGVGWLIKLFHIGSGYSFDVNSSGAFWNGTSLLGGGSGDNSSWNETYADTLYSDIQWNYNQSIATFNMWNATWDNSFMNIWNYNQSLATFGMWNITWSSTYNSTYDSATGGNSSWNETYADTLYCGIEYDYNQSLATFGMWNSTWDNSFMNIWNYNQSLATYNMWNTIWSSTYNSTYDVKVSFPGWTNVTFINESNTFTENQNFTKNVTIGPSTIYFNGSDLIWD